MASVFGPCNVGRSVVPGSGIGYGWRLLFDVSNVVFDSARFFVCLFY
jgi:hypothetical protein